MLRQPIRLARPPLLGPALFLQRANQEADDLLALVTGRAAQSVWMGFSDWFMPVLFDWRGFIFLFFYFFDSFNENYSSKICICNIFFA